MSTGRIQLFTLTKKVENSYVNQKLIQDFLMSNILEGVVSSDIIDLLKSPVNLEVTQLTETGDVDVEQRGIGSLIISGMFALLLGLSLMLSSNYLLQGLGEEKESRLIEVLLSSVSVRQLLTGKVLGLGTAGLVQILIWLISAPLLLKLATSLSDSTFSSLTMPSNFFLLGTLYFILGYILFAVLSIGIGAISPNAREGQLLAMIYTMFSFVPLWLLSLLMFFPNSPVWVVLSIFPLTAPVQTMLRLGIADVPLWQVLTSLSVLILSIIFVLFSAIRVFRAHLLMHGKRPGIREIVQNLKHR
jgi:ABC-2 type transport system permease protein